MVHDVFVPLWSDMRWINSAGRDCSREEMEKVGDVLGVE